MAAARSQTLPEVPDAQAAEHAFYRVVDAQCADLALLRERWPDRTSPESRGAIDRLTARAAPDGDADRATAALHRAYGGSARVPEPVRRRLERYVLERMGGKPWPERDLSEDLSQPAIVRKQRRRRREASQEGG
jgi:hypothetical protein